MIARELCDVPFGMRGSSGPLQALRMKSMSSTGSQRVHIAHITSKRSVGIDVVVHHHDEAAEIGAGLAVRREHRRLARVAGIGLLDGDDVEHAGAAEFVAPHAGDAGKTRRARPRPRSFRPS